MIGQSFAFGKNWQVFVREYMSEARVKEAEKSLVDFCAKKAIKGKTFLDVGCGSGLFSLAAYRLRAKRVVSFDIDHHSIQCTKYIREKEESPPNWQILQGSIIDRKFVARLGTFDFVYAWGVLHHTGSLWEALKNTAALVSQGGLLYVSIYNKAYCLGLYDDGRFLPSSFWEKEKRWYSQLPVAVQSLVAVSATGVWLLVYLSTFKNPIRFIREYQKKRGMAWWIDLKDWLGGYPYEYASVEEVFQFMKSLGYVLENIKTNSGLRNNEYLFKHL